MKELNLLNRTDTRLHADPGKVILRFLDFGRAERFEPVIRFVLNMDETAAEAQLQKVFAEFEHRHFDLKGAFLNNFERLRQFVPGETTLAKKLLIGSYFTHEYSVEASALFNPSIVSHPDQTGLGEGELRFVMSLRATGEGHISSIAFLTGIIGAVGDIVLDPMPSKMATGRISQQGGLNYDVSFDPAIPLPSRLLFPHSDSETNGMEDARFVHFKDGAESRYLGTYTAYNGRAIRPQLIETHDFLHFHIRPFEGNAASDKGMAIFPEKIKGQYAMVGRQGGRSLSIMYADDLYRWDNFGPLQHPRRGWEYLQMGNCGSPVKTPQGWLLLTHAVGPMRKYVLSASLLDLDHPEKVIASLDQPLLSPNAEEREGYVPNVLYTCGLLEHQGTLFIPYAMSDSAIGFATAKTEDLIVQLLKSKI